MTNHKVHKFWLKISALIVGGFGPFLTLGTMPVFSEPARWGLDLLTWPLDGFPSYEAPEIWVYDLAPEQVRRVLLVSIGCWFVLDSFGSITSGNWPNAIWNILVLLLVIGPMWRPARG